MKTAVIGYSGSGKSTLAANIAQQQGTEVVHLDRIFWQPGWVHRDREEMRRLVGEYLWIGS